MRYGRGSGVSHPVDVHIGARIRARRISFGMSQVALATAIGLSFQQVQKYERGASRITASLLSAIADVLAVPVSFFFIKAPAPRDDARMEQPEIIELVRCYYTFPSGELRWLFLQMVKAWPKAVPQRVLNRNHDFPR